MSDNARKLRLDPGMRNLAIALIVGILAVVFDTTIVNVALDTLAKKLSTNLDTIHWVTTGYLLALGMSVPLSGWLTNRFGGKRAWIGALGLFVFGSLLNSLAWNATSLIAFRVIQGIGGGLMMPIMQSLFAKAAGGKNLGSIMSVVSLPIVLGPMLGPMLGGIIVTNLPWQWIFLVNLPLGVVGLLLAWKLMPEFPPGPRQRLDVLGLVLLSPGIALVIYGMSRVANTGSFISAEVLVPAAAGLILILLFVARSLKSPEIALVDLSPFRNPEFRTASILFFLAGAVLYGAMLLLPLYAQQIKGQTAIVAGILMAPQGVGSLLSRSIAGRLTDRIGARWVVFVSLLIVTLGTIPFVYMNVSTPYWYIVVSLLFRGFGLGGVIIPIMATAFEGLEEKKIPHASMLTRISQLVGGSFGTALIAVILESRISASSSQGMSGLVSSFDGTFVWAMSLSAIAVVVALMLPSKRTAALETS